MVDQSGARLRWCRVRRPVVSDCQVGDEQRRQTYLLLALLLQGDDRVAVPQRASAVLGELCKLPPTPLQRDRLGGREHDFLTLGRGEVGVPISRIHQELQNGRTL